MPQLRIGIAQLDVTVGALEANANQILEVVKDAARQGAQLVATGYMSISGHPIADLARRDRFLDAAHQAATGLAHELQAAGLGETSVLVGIPARTAEDQPVHRVLHLHGGQARPVHDSPTTGTQPAAPTPIDVGGHQVAVGTYPDHEHPTEQFPSAAVTLLLDAHRYYEGTPAAALTTLAAIAHQTGHPVAHVNLAGAQDGIVFTGGSSLLNGEGQLLARAPLFEPHLLVLDVPGAGGTSTDGHKITRELEPDAEVYTAIVTALRAYVHKNGFRSVVLGLSGGIDSALLAVLAADAIGGPNVVGVSMPSAFSSDHSRDDAADLAKRIDAHLLTHPIEDIVDEVTTALDLEGVARENLQARVRGLILMGLSNAHGHLVLAPGNKSELAVGYSTIYGDAVGGYAPLKDLVKTRVWALSRWRNNSAIDSGEIPPIPESSITKPPSAELSPGQMDSDSLPPYPILDAILQGYLEQDQGRAQLLDAGHDPAIIDRVIAMVDRAEWKRQQFPIGPQVTPRPFASRDVPITNAWHEPATDAAILDATKQHEEPNR